MWRAIILAPLLTGLSIAAPVQSWEETTGSAYQAYERAGTAEAEKLFQDALAQAEKFEAGDARLSTSLNNLAALYDAKGRYRDAEPLYRRSLLLAEKALGPRTPT